MRLQSYHYILLSGFFGLLSILADQYSYQLEKSILSLEYLKDNEINRVEFGYNANELAVSLQGTMDEQFFYSNRFDDISVEEKTRSFNQLKFSFGRQINELSSHELFSIIKPESLDRNSQKYLGFITTEDNFYDDLFNFYDNFWDDLKFIIVEGSQLSTRSLTEVLRSFEKIADLRFYRQISLLTAICCSFLSLFFIFIFFKRFIKEKK
tara:strand:+ start:1268 stop:1894 length:627 start_codon:yes stop_codon:yes gene_type:complete